MPVLRCNFGNGLPLGKWSLCGELPGLLILLPFFLPLAIHTMCFPLVFPLRSPSGLCSLWSLLTIARWSVSIESQNVKAAPGFRVNKTTPLPNLRVRIWRLRRGMQVWLQSQKQNLSPSLVFFLLHITSGLLNIVLPSPVLLGEIPSAQGWAGIHNWCCYVKSVHLCPCSLDPSQAVLW